MDLDLEDLEDLELFDGVLPSDHPETYSGLLRATCIMADSPIYVSIGAWKRKLCILCYYRRTTDSRWHYRRHNSWHSVSTYTGRDLRDCLKCVDCDYLLATTAPVNECRRCITAYILHEKIFDRFRGYEWDVNKL